MENDLLYVIRAVEERRPYVEEILKQIPDAVVYWDKERNAMKSYLHVCKNIVGERPAVLLEDDVILTSDFKEKIEAVINEYPKILINFFNLSKTKTHTRFQKGREYSSSLCEYFPSGFGKRVADSYEAWVIEDGGKNPTAYDYLVRYAWGYDKPYIVWCPSLVQHRKVKSVINGRRSTKRQSVTFVE